MKSYFLILPQVNKTSDLTSRSIRITSVRLSHSPVLFLLQIFFQMFFRALHPEVNHCRPCTRAKAYCTVTQKTLESKQERLTLWSLNTPRKLKRIIPVAHTHIFIYKHIIHTHAFHPTYTTLISLYATSLWSNVRLQLYCYPVKVGSGQRTNTLCCKENPCSCADSLDGV